MVTSSSSTLIRLIAQFLISIMVCLFAGERSEDKEDLLQEQGVQEAHAPQGHPIQEGQGQHRRSGKTPL
ncbi:hypothetical protein D0Y65_019887 [Glycine soja]|uniref:Uncharacterized protein n=1 Tax=Glycine soja TaxID=3848 RepID=A0A445JBJ2_GLYSO|nr:hypothetical protein D0Y65_019887 [Glycine soja]